MIQSQLREATDRSQPREATDQSQPREATDRSQPREATDRSQPREATDQSQLREATDRSQLRQEALALNGGSGVVQRISVLCGLTLQVALVAQRTCSTVAEESVVAYKLHHVPSV